MAGGFGPGRPLRAGLRRRFGRRFQGLPRRRHGGAGGPGGAAGAFGGGRAGGLGGLLDTSTPDSALVDLLKQDTTSTWAAAAIGSNSAAGVQLASGRPVMAIGGFNGSDPSPTLAEFQADVAAGKVHYFLGERRRWLRRPWRLRRPGRRVRAPRARSRAGSRSNFTSTTVGGVTVYDLTQSTSGSCLIFAARHVTPARRGYRRRHERATLRQVDGPAIGASDNAADNADPKVRDDVLGRGAQEGVSDADRGLDGDDDAGSRAPGDTTQPRTGAETPVDAEDLRARPRAGRHRCDAAPRQEDLDAQGPAAVEREVPDLSS